MFIIIILHDYIEYYGYWFLMFTNLKKITQYPRYN